MIIRIRNSCTLVLKLFSIHAQLHFNDLSCYNVIIAIRRNKYGDKKNPLHVIIIKRYNALKVIQISKPKKKNKNKKI